MFQKYKKSRKKKSKKYEQLLKENIALKRELQNTKSDMKSKDNMIGRYKATLLQKAKEIKDLHTVNLDVQKKILEKIDEYGKHNLNYFLYNFYSYIK